MQTVGRSLAHTSTGDLSISELLLLVFVPPSLLMVLYIWAGYLAQDAVPSLLLFFLLAAAFLFPTLLGVVLFASKKAYGIYSLHSAFANHQPLSRWKIGAYTSLLFGFAGLMTVTVLPFEERLFAPLAERLNQLVPPYFDWTQMDYLDRYPTNVLLLTGVLYLVLNGFLGPIVEEFYFRGYLTARMSRFGAYAPFIITVLFSLYHFWLPFNNLFRIIAFFPAFYVAWKLKNIYIAIVFHCLCNLVTAIGFMAALYSRL
jgi:uncharacterized protein